MPSPMHQSTPRGAESGLSSDSLSLSLSPSLSPEPVKTTFHETLCPRVCMYHDENLRVTFAMTARVFIVSLDNDEGISNWVGTYCEGQRR